MPVSEGTRELYGTHASRFARWIAAGGHDPDDPRSWVAALQVLGGRVSRKSWRLYRNAVTWHLGTTRGRAFRTEFLLLTDAVTKPPERRRRLQRRIDPGTLHMVADALRARRGDMGGHLADLLVATVATGIRPNEWQGTTRPRPGVLAVANAKHRPPEPGVPGRGNGPVRELVLDPAAAGTPVEAAIGRTIEWLRGRSWRTVSPNANPVLRRTVAELVARGELAPEWKRLRIYDCRHQFAADAKASLSLLDGEVAAVMGHVSAVTAVAHYGKRRHAAGRSVVKPSAASVQAVDRESLARVVGRIGRTRAALEAAGRVEPRAPARAGRRALDPAPRGTGPDRT